MNSANPRKPDEPLKRSMSTLERALAAPAAGREYQWSASVADALDLVQAAMRSRPADPASSEAVDDTRPTLARQARDLHRDYSDCLDWVKALHVEIKRVSQAFAPRARAKVREDVAIPDFRDIRRRAADLLDCLQRVRDEEANLVLESVNTDIGVGD